MEEKEKEIVFEHYEFFREQPDQYMENVLWEPFDLVC